MDMSGGISVQHQIKENGNELSDFLNDLDKWKHEMKEKDEKLKERKETEEKSIPPIRSSKPKPEVSKTDKQADNRISGYDYRAWDKFDVEKACEEVQLKPTEKSDSLQFELKKQEALYHKDKGNECFKNGKYQQAIEFYSRGIECDSKNAVLSANRAMAYLKLQKYLEAEKDCSIAIKLDPTYVKAYMRRGTSRMKRKIYVEAEEDFNKVIELEPANKQAVAEIKLLKSDLIKLTKKKIDEKRNCKKIGSDKNDNKVLNLKSGVCLKEEVVKAIEKPVILRSKKPLRRIFVEEINASKTINEITKSSSELPISESSVNYLSKKIEKSSSININKPPGNIKDVIVVKKSTTPTKMFTQPKTSFQFETSWTKLKGSPTGQKQYLKNLDVDRIPEMFKSGMEIDPFVEIIENIAFHYNICGDDPVPMLTKLSQIGRFKALSLFISDSAKEGLRKVLDNERIRSSYTVTILSNISACYSLN